MHDHAQQGAVAGGALGAATGAIIGHQSSHGGEGAFIGAGAGTIAGGLIGHGIDQNKPPPQRHEHEYDSSTYYNGDDYYEGEYDAEGRKWAPEHEETRVYTAPDGSRYEKKIVVPAHYEQTQRGCSLRMLISSRMQPFFCLQGP